MKVENIESIKIKIASPEKILSWSHGEVTKPETINYRTQRPERDGLFCERIFGPVKDYECACGKYKKIRYKGIICDRCGVEITYSSVRRERMGHIKLATPVAHIWFLRGVPSRIGLILNLSSQQLERIVYFSAYIITKVDEAAKKQVLGNIDKEYKTKIKKVKGKEKKEKLKAFKDKIRQQVLEIKPLAILSEETFRDLSLKYGEIFEVGTGAETLRKICEGIDLKKLARDLQISAKKTSPASKKRILQRLKLIQGMITAQIRPEWTFFTVLPVLPPELRPMVQLDGGRFASSDLNDLYRRIINRNNRLKYLLEINAPEVIVRNEKRMLQEVVDALIDNEMRKGIVTTATTGGKRLLKSLADMIAGKEGRFRQNLLGKRVDYSGRSVIAVSPELKLNQCGLPKTMALELFKPFVIKGVLEKELAYNIKGANRLIDEEIPEIWAILEEIVKNKLVLLNRAPTLHRLGIQAFQPVLIEGKAIKINPLICEAFNADFDGDQMAVHLPLSEEAQQEAKKIMLSTYNLLKPATGFPVVMPRHEIVLGCYYLTDIEKNAKGEGKFFENSKIAILAYENGVVDLQAKIKCSLGTVPTGLSPIETTVGRLIFNEVLPENFPYLNEIMGKKALINLAAKINQKYPPEIFQQTLDKIKDLGFEYATLSGISLGVDDFIVPKEKQGLINKAEKKVEIVKNYFKKGLLTKEERKSQVITIWQQVISEIEKLVPKTLPSKGSVSLIINSGGRGSWVQPIQMCGMKGLVISPQGEIVELPIKNSLKEGFNVLEYFISTHGARKGIVDTALRTASAGYLTRRLVDVAHDMIVTEEDCGDKDGIIVFKKDAKDIEEDFIFKIAGRISLEDIKIGKSLLTKKGDEIDWQAAELIKNSKIEKLRVRSPLSCRVSRGVCQKCYGWDLGKGKLVELGQAVGVIAAQSIGEPGTQLTLRTFHLGGVAGASDITQGLPRAEEVFETRSPKGEGVMSEIDGKVISVLEKERTIKILTKKAESSTYEIPRGVSIRVKAGEFVKKGQPLCEGNLDLKKLFKIVGKEETQRHILQEIQKVYSSQGVDIHDKHIELIIRQMFSRVRILEEGGSSWLKGEIVNKDYFQEENLKLKRAQKEEAKSQPVLLGISDISLSSDSFLSAASFQETSRVLIKAALLGQEDKLEGLKENVIIGKLIPVGTGFKKK